MSNKERSHILPLLGKKESVKSKIDEGIYSLFSKEKMKSEVWQSFKGVLDENNEEVFGFCCCVNCHACIRYKSIKNGKTKDFGTKNLRDHLLFCGTERKRGRKKKEQILNHQSNFKIAAQNGTGSDYNKIRQAISKSRGKEAICSASNDPVVCKMENLAEDELLNEINSHVEQFSQLENEATFVPITPDDDPKLSFFEAVARAKKIASIIGPDLTRKTDLNPIPNGSPDLSDKSAKLTNPNYEDEHDVFGRHVANELRSLPEDASKRWARFQIQKILFEAHSFQGNERVN